ncbi:MAG: TIGR04211 family SH3 domain-containing protein [Pseudomonadales bacterium]|nr:TIGR04211 family SH3 domain-containing protein [Pseudomonadales bacterium]
MLARLVCLLAVLSASGTAAASAAWVDDSIYVPIRASASPGGRILHRGIKSGTRIEFLGFEGDWAKIRYGDIEGYIGKQYLSQTPTAEILLERAQKASEAAKAEAAKLRTQLAELKGERDALAEQSSELKNSLNARSNELEQLQEVASDPIRLDQANRRLNEELSLLRSELDQVKGENVMLRNNNTSQQWITGVAILLLGLVAGIIMRSRSGRRRNSGWAN